MSPAELPRGTVTFLFTDIEGSTDLARQLGADFGAVRAEHHRKMREAIEAHGGHEIDTAGDGFFVAFERAGDAVAAALEAQRALHTSESEDIAIRVRMGLHSAEPYVHDGSYHGVGVHRAARICAAGHGGQILLSNATAGIVEDLNLSGVSLADLGEHRLKDIEQPQRIVQVVAAGLSDAFPPLRTEDSLPTVATLFYADIVEYAALLPVLGDDEAGQAASRFRRIVVDTVRMEGGREREVFGDKVWATFERPVGALRTAMRARRRLREGEWFPGEAAPEVRWGIHSGRVNPGATGDISGSAWVRCVELCMSGEPGQILVSESTEALLVGEVHDLELRELGERKLRDVDRPMRVFELEP